MKKRKTLAAMLAEQRNINAVFQRRLQGTEAAIQIEKDKVRRLRQRVACVIKYTGLTATVSYCHVHGLRQPFSLKTHLRSLHML